MVEAFRAIHPSSFVHPEDAAALAALRAVPGLSALLKALQSNTVEERVFAMIGTTTLKLGRSQYRSLYAMVERACTRLDVPVPEVYLSGNHEINAWAFGYTRYAITLNAGLVDRFRDEEVASVVGHEVGHIACEHMLYKSTALVLTQLGAHVLGRLLGPISGLATAGIELALFRWSRAAEYSCDRAALLVMQDPDLVASTIAGLGGSSHRLREEFSLEAVETQARDLQSSVGRFGKVMDGLRQMYTTHPDPIPRSLAIRSWGRSAEYHAILGGRYRTRMEVGVESQGIIEGVASCALCGTPVGEASACPKCGLSTRAADQRRCPGGHPVNADWKFCRSCGKPTG